MSVAETEVEELDIERSWIGNLHADAGRVRICGLVDTIRSQKRMVFLVVADRSGQVQVTVDRASDGDIADRLGELTQGSAVEIVGDVVAAPGVKLRQLEVYPRKVNVASLAASPLPIAIDSSLEKQIDWRQVSLRTSANQLTLAVQTTFEHAMRQFWRDGGFVELHSPKLMGTFSESGAEVFKVRYFGDRTAYLAQSPQFYKQMAMAAGLERVFEIGPAFRAEPSFTSRHETEFTSIDMELSWITSHLDVMEVEEAWLVHSLGAVVAEHGEDIAREFGVEIRIPSRPFPRLSIAKARQILESRGHLMDGKPDIDSEGERAIAAYVLEEFGHEFVWLTDYPTATRAFYHMRQPDNPTLTKGFDLLWKGLEVTTGAQREHRYDVLVEQAKERGFDLEPLADYLNFFKYGCPPHGGAGIGLARLLMVMLGRASIRDVTLLSRTPTRLTP